MSTVYQRIKFFCKVRKMRLLPQKDRLVIGKQIADTYRQQNGKVPEKRLLIQEPEGKFNVQWYPTDFIPAMDKVIGNFHAGSVKSDVSHEMSKVVIESVPEPVPVRKRKRIPLNRVQVKY